MEDLTNVPSEWLRNRYIEQKQQIRTLEEDLEELRQDIKDLKVSLFRKGIELVCFNNFCIVLGLELSVLDEVQFLISEYLNFCLCSTVFGWIL